MSELTSGVNNLDLSVADADAILARVRLCKDSVATIADEYDIPIERIVQLYIDAHQLTLRVAQP